MNKCDLVLSASTHHFECKFLSGYKDKGALLINTGSITEPDNSPHGYVEIHVIEEPLRLIVQYIDAGKSDRMLQMQKGFAFMKIIGGTVSELSFNSTVNQD